MRRTASEGRKERDTKARGKRNGNGAEGGVAREEGRGAGSRSLREPAREGRGAAGQGQDRPVPSRTFGVEELGAGRGLDGAGGHVVAGEDLCVGGVRAVHVPREHPAGWRGREGRKVHPRAPLELDAQRLDQGVDLVRRPVRVGVLADDVHAAALARRGEARRRQPAGRQPAASRRQRADTAQRGSAKKKKK